MEKTEALKSKIKAALLYPAAVIIVTFIVVTILHDFHHTAIFRIIRRFWRRFTSLDAVPGRHIQFFVAKWYIIFSVVVGAVYGLIQLKMRNKTFQQLIDYYSLKMSVISVVLKKSAIARFALTLEKQPCLLPVRRWLKP